MANDISNPEKEYKDAVKKIQELKKTYQSSYDPYQRETLQKEISRLEDYNEKLMTLFTLESAEEQEETARDSGTTVPYLNRINQLPAKGCNDQEILNFRAYNNYFEAEFLLIFRDKHLKLDFKYSIERDSFYNKLNELNRHLNEFCEDSQNLSQETKIPALKQELIRRRNKTRRILFLEMHNFYTAIYDFTQILLKDIGKYGFICLNGFEVLDLTQYKNTPKLLRGDTVQKALDKLLSFSQEVIQYVKIPNF